MSDQQVKSGVVYVWWITPMTHNGQRISEFPALRHTYLSLCLVVGQHSCEDTKEFGWRDLQIAFMVKSNEWINVKCLTITAVRAQVGDRYKREDQKRHADTDANVGRPVHICSFITNNVWWIICNRRNRWIFPCCPWKQMYIMEKKRFLLASLCELSASWCVSV